VSFLTLFYGRDYSMVEIISKNIPSVSAPEIEEDLVIEIFIGR
jgi:hypothetical protein